MKAVDGAAHALADALRVNVIPALYAWREARSRVPARDHTTPDQEWLRLELDRSCAAYEAALGERRAP